MGKISIEGKLNLALLVSSRIFSYSCCVVYACLSEEGLGDEKKKREGKRGGESRGRKWKRENKVDFQDQGRIYSNM